MRASDVVAESMVPDHTVAMTTLPKVIAPSLHAREGSFPAATPTRGLSRSDRS